VAVQTIWNDLPGEAIHKSVLRFRKRFTACMHKSWKRTFWTFD